MSRAAGRKHVRRPAHASAPAPRPDPYFLGLREAQAGVAKTSSIDWLAAGRSAAEWYAYSVGYDGEAQR